MPYKNKSDHVANKAAYYQRRKVDGKSHSHSPEAARKASWKRNHRGVKNLPAYEDRPKTCPNCGSSERISMDHCHKAMMFRGWLCHTCNSALGWAKEDAARLRGLADYIEQFQS